MHSNEMRCTYAKASTEAFICNLLICFAMRYDDDLFGTAEAKRTATHSALIERKTLL